MGSLEFVSFVGVHYVGGGFTVRAELRSRNAWSSCEPAAVCRSTASAVLRSESEFSCVNQRCNILAWARQTQRLATGLAVATARRTSVHVYTRCIPEEAANVALAGSSHAAPIVVHNTHDPQLLDALNRMRNRAVRWGRRPNLPGHLRTWRTTSFLSLLKWCAVASTWAELAVVLDIDTEPLPLLRDAMPPLRPVSGAAVGATAPSSLGEAHSGVVAHWLLLLRCAQRQNASLLAHSDHSSPVNMAVAILRPSVAMYDEGVAALRRAGDDSNAQNATDGWDGVGRPLAVLPPTDHAWELLRRGRRLGMMVSNDWTFVGADQDQGEAGAS